MPKGAVLCSTCGTYQDWRRFLPLSPIILALLTALVSVVGIAAPALYSTFKTPRSETHLEAVTIDGTTLRVLATNRGDAPSTVWRARTGGDFLAPATKSRLRDEADAIIPQGSKLLVFDIIPLLSEEQSYAASLEVLATMLAEEEMPRTTVLISVTESTGRINLNIEEISDLDMFEMLRYNADRCSAIAEPNFANGCIGPGDTEEEQFNNAQPRTDN